jgi:Tfp pilus assembly protein PilF
LISQVIEKAIEDLNTAIEMDPKLIEAYYWRAVAYIEAQQNDNAIKDLEFVIANTDITELRDLAQEELNKLRP